MKFLLNYGESPGMGQLETPAVGLEPPILGSEVGRRFFPTPRASKDLRRKKKVAVLSRVFFCFPDLAAAFRVLPQIAL
jgi:hypothetical protein